jgi:hypothetical protein
MARRPGRIGPVAFIALTAIPVTIVGALLWWLAG